MKQNRFKNIGLTGRILLSIWFALVLVVISVFMVFKSNEPSSNNMPIPPVQLNDDLLLKLLNEPYSDVKTWFKTQDKRDIRRIFVVKSGREILNRRLPRFLKRIEKQLSDQRPFIHKQERGRAMLGRLLLLPSGERIHVLVFTRISPPPLHHIILDSVAYLLLLFILVSGLISWLLTRYILKPIIQLRKATQQIAQGNFDLRLSGNIKQSGDIASLASDFDQMSDALQRSIQSHKHLIQDISHELRSPIARLQLACELAKQAYDAQNSEYFLRMDKEIEQVRNMISTLLNLPAYELEPHLSLQDSIDLIELIRTIVQDFHFQVPEKLIQLDNQLPFPFSNECIIKANSQLLHSAFENILKNALNYHQGHEAVSIRIYTSQSDNEKKLMIECCDKGPGVESDQLTDIFKPFYRTSNARDRESGGHGLGLAISKRSIELHAGRIMAYNRKQGGLCVQVTLPWHLITNFDPT